MNKSVQNTCSSVWWPRKRDWPDAPSGPWAWTRTGFGKWWPAWSLRAGERRAVGWTCRQRPSRCVLERLGLSAEQIRRQLRRMVQEAGAGSASTRQPQTARGRRERRSKTPLIDQLATDLTALAEEGRLDPVIGREKEIERVIQILARRTKNNPVLIGDPGVGKTAIVEGLAQRIVEGNVPAPLLGKRVLQLNRRAPSCSLTRSTCWWARVPRALP